MAADESDVTQLTEGDEVAVEYESVQGNRGNTQRKTGTVLKTVNYLADSDTHTNVEIFVTTDGGSHADLKIEASSAGDGLMVDVETARRAHDTRTRSGEVTSVSGTYARVSRYTTATLFVAAEEDDSEDDSEDEEADESAEPAGYDDIAEGDRVHVRDDTADSTVAEGTVTEVNEEGFSMEVGGVRTKRYEWRPDGRVKPTGTCFTYVATVEEKADTPRNQQDDDVCARCHGTAVHTETRRANSWINEASAYDVFLYECEACGAEGKRNEKGGRHGRLFAPPEEPDALEVSR